MLPILLEQCLIGNDPTKYQFVAQGMVTIDGVDDAEEMRITDEAFDVLGFTAVRNDWLSDVQTPIVLNIIGRKIKYV